MGFLVAALAGIGGQVGHDFIGTVAQAVALLLAQRAGDVVDVIAAVAVVGEAQLLAAEFEIAQPHAGGEDVHLPAGVVDIVLALHLKPAGFQHAGEAGAVGRAASMADVQRAGRIGGDEFHGDPLAQLLP